MVVGRSLRRLHKRRPEVREVILPKSKEDFAYKVDELDPVDKSFFRRRDNFTKYVEASAMYKLLSKKGS